MRYEVDQDDRPIYSDVGMFVKGRSGYREDPHKRDELNARWAFGAFIMIVVVFGLVHALLPSIR
jgi:hypothetical protein